LDEEGVSEVQLELMFYNALRFSDNRSKSDQTLKGEAEAGFDKLNIL